MKHYLLLAICCILYMGCMVPLGKLTTESGKPEVLITNTHVDAVMTAIRSWAPTKGQIVTIAEGNMVTTSSSVEVPINYAATQNIGAKTVYNVVAKGADVKVYALRFIAAKSTNYGYYHPISEAGLLTNEYNSQEAYDQLQAELSELVTYVKGK